MSAFVCPTAADRTSTGSRRQPELREHYEGVIDSEIRDEALAELDQLGPERSARKWWAFEGITKVDCCLETERLVLFAEGKRTESLAKRTNWFPQRDQLTRNLDLVGRAAGDRRGFVLLAVETHVEEPTDAKLANAAPHLGAEAPRILRQRYLGQATWRDLCRATGVDYNSLPEELSG